MIISIRGINGAGKSHLVRRIMNLYPASVAVPFPPEMGKTSTMGVSLSRLDGRSLFVVGFYRGDRMNGGLDTMKTGVPQALNFAYGLIYSRHENENEDVVYEGQNREDGTARLLGVHAMGVDVRVIILETPLHECVAALRRRGSVLAEREDDLQRLQSRVSGHGDEFRAAGVRAVGCDRESAYERIREWLRLPERCE